MFNNSFSKNSFIVRNREVYVGDQAIKCVLSDGDDSSHFTLFWICYAFKVQQNVAPRLHELFPASFTAHKLCSVEKNVKFYIQCIWCSNPQAYGEILNLL